VPRDREDDYTREAAERRLEFARERAGASLEHVSSYSFDPAILSGNVEQFIGVAQVPIGLAGPLLVHAATVLCGELSLGSAIVAEEWVEAHDLLGRNRP
jgi:hydroxymethylglutaryl-CoA reductase